MKTHGIPNEILHYTERAEYKRYKRQKRMAFFENIIFALLLITLVALSFYSGRLIERYFSIHDSVKASYQLKGGIKVWKI